MAEIISSRAEITVQGAADRGTGFGGFVSVGSSGYVGGARGGEGGGAVRPPTREETQEPECPSSASGVSSDDLIKTVGGLTAVAEPVVDLNVTDLAMSALAFTGVGAPVTAAYFAGRFSYEIGKAVLEAGNTPIEDTPSASCVP